MLPKLKAELIEKHKHTNKALQEMVLMKIVILEVNLENSWVFGSTVTHDKNNYFLHTLEQDAHGTYFHLHNRKFYLDTPIP